MTQHGKVHESPPETRLLVDDWRRLADEHWDGGPGCSEVWRNCADELEAAFSPEAVPSLEVLSKSMQKRLEAQKAEAVPSAPAGLRARAEALLAKITPGEWCVWNGHGYIGGGEDLCIGAGESWLANMDHRHCQNHAHHIGCHDDGCRLEGDADICSVGDEVTAEQRANADFIAAAPKLVRDLLAALPREDTP